jgi:hypothetical protein
VLGSTSALTPDQARTAAKESLGGIALGEDPGAARSRTREIPSFREFAERYAREGELRFSLTRISERPAYAQLREHTRDIQRLTTEF